VTDRLSGSEHPGREAGAAVDASRTGLVVLAATRAETLEPLRPELASLARRAPLALAVPRLVTGGALGPAFTYGVGHLFGIAIG